MALSGVRDQADTVTQIVTDALGKIYVAVGGETVSAEDLAKGIRVLKHMLRTWAVDGVRLWLINDQTVTLVAGTATYALTVRALDVSQAWIRTDGNDTPVRILTREEYNRLPDKTASGSPFSLFVDRDLAATSVTVYPVPDATSAANDSLRVTTKYQIQDVTSGGEDIEVPPEWTEALVYNLAVRLAPDFAAEVRPDVAGMAMELYAVLKGNDRQGSIMFRPRRY